MLDYTKFNMSSESAVSIITDLEPDDMLSLIIIFQKAMEIFREEKQFPIKQIVVGGYYAEIQQQRMLYWLGLFKQFGIVPDNIDIDVIIGADASNPNNPKNINLGRVEFGDDKAVSARQTASLRYQQKPYAGENAAESLLRFMQTNTNSMIINLKPIDELLQLYKLYPVEFETAQQQTVLVSYGSFNTKASLAINDRGEVENETEIKRIYQGFQQGITIERAPLFGKNSSTGLETTPNSVATIAELIQQSNHSNPLFQQLNEFILAWNIPMVRKQQPRLLNHLQTIKSVVDVNHVIRTQFCELMNIEESKLADIFMDMEATLERDWVSESFHKHTFASAVENLEKLFTSSLIISIAKSENLQLHDLSAAGYQYQIWSDISKYPKQIILADPCVAAIAAGFDLRESLQPAIIKSITSGVEYDYLQPNENNSDYLVPKPDLTEQDKLACAKGLDVFIAALLAKSIIPELTAVTDEQVQNPASAPTAQSTFFATNSAPKAGAPKIGVFPHQMRRTTTGPGLFPHQRRNFPAPADTSDAQPEHRSNHPG